MLPRIQQGCIVKDFYKTEQKKEEETDPVLQKESINCGKENLESALGLFSTVQGQIMDSFNKNKQATINIYNHVMFILPLI